MKVYDNFIELIGNTPLVRLEKIEKLYNTKANLICKIESFNPAGSIKDRIGKEMIFDALEKGLINKDTVLVDATSGNTGIGLAMVAAILNMKLIIAMPNTMSVERIKLLKAYGAEVVLTDGSLGMRGAISKAHEIAQNTPNSFVPSQFTNKANPLSHYKTTGKEIYDDLDGKVDVVVAGVGTGCTISGVGKFLKEKNPNVKIIAVEPLSSAVLSGEKSGPHLIQGIGAGFIPDTLDTNIYDEVIKISNEEALNGGRIIAKTEGILVGISSGASLMASIKVAQRDELKDKNVVVIFPDGGEKYLSTKLFEE